MAALVKHPALAPPLESMKEHLFPGCFGTQWPQPRESPRGHAAETEPPELGLSLGKKRWKETQFVTLTRALLRHVSLFTHNYSCHDHSCKTACSLPETKLHPSTLCLLRKPPSTARCSPMQLCYSDALSARWANCKPSRHFLKYLLHTDIISIVH